MNQDISLQQQFDQQRFPNGYELIDGVEMHEQNGERFQIPPDVIKKYIVSGQFIELRIDSPRFSVHEDSPEKCYCDSCCGEASKPILRHEQPASMVGEPRQAIPSRGWGEDFWVRVTAREGCHFKGAVDNPLYETRLHGIQQSDELLFHQDHLLAVHDSHRQELVSAMEPADLRQLAAWLASLE